ncbi:SPJ_0845 family protein [Paucilactobacillus kaifaensis]|uniref:SPJ_0845 family protein n=1 Tax=Paucilactobacillus kaifaensis TaxID=2559921 RepID=UPI001484EC3A|nr:SPJ_0845 family protein [Paucilactobacillus kaifaensis]
MGLIVRRELNLEKLFDDFAVDPKKKAPKQPERKDKDDQKQPTDQNKHDEAKK